MITGKVHTLETEVKRGNGKASGKAYAIQEQAIMLTFPSGEVRKFSLTSNEGDAPLPLGNYSPKPSAAYIDGYALAISARAKDWQKVA